MKSFTMKKSLADLKSISMVAAVALLMTACASTPKAPKGSAEVRSKLTQLQSDPQLATRAPVALKDAEQAVVEAEKPNKDKAVEAHQVWIADRKVDTATAQAQAYFLEDQRKLLSEQTANARLDSRTLEADNARNDANLARNEADSAKQQADELQRQISELNAKATERGLVVTLGDLLFETGRADLKSNAMNNLSKLSAFLNKYQNRSVIIEGHTDSVGSESSNYTLSQRRADAVKAFLLNQGIAGSRIVSTGKGEGVPVADNDTPNGRQLNRRVEVIIANPDTTAAQ